LFDRETGLLCEVSNPKSVAEKVLELHKDEILRKHIIERAFNMVVEKYDWNNIAGQMNQVFVKTLYKKAEKA
jgi:glycosyltransferase involved in cell wall biosynthesis